MFHTWDNGGGGGGARPEILGTGALRCSKNGIFWGPVQKSKILKSIFLAPTAPIMICRGINRLNKPFSTDKTKKTPVKIDF